MKLASVKVNRQGPRPPADVMRWLRELDSYANATFGVRSLVREMRQVRADGGRSSLRVIRPE